MSPLSVRKIENTRMSRAVFGNPVGEPAGVLIIGSGQILGGGRIALFGETHVDLVECWAVSDLKVRHWSLVNPPEIAVVPMSDYVVIAAVLATLGRFAAQTEVLLRSAGDRKEGVLDAVRAWAQEVPAATLKAAADSGG